MNYVYMSTCMKALCRHVKQNKQQTDTNFLRVVTCCCLSQEALSLWSAVRRVRRQNQKLYKQLLEATGRLAANAAHVHWKDLQSHREGVSIEIHFVSSSQFSWLVEKDRLIWSLWNHIQPWTIVFLNPSLSWNSISWNVFHIACTGICSVVWWLIVWITVISVSWRAWWCSLITLV